VANPPEKFKAPGLKIAVNTRFLLAGQLEGFGKFTAEIFSRVVRAHPEHTFYFLFDRPFAEEFVFAGNVIPVVISPPARHPVLWYIWYQQQIRKFLKKEKIDLFISTDGQTVLNSPVPTLTVIHDLAFEHYPEHIKWLQRKYLQHFTSQFARNSTRLIAVSEFTRQDIATHYQVPVTKIDLVGNAASAVFRPSSEKEQNHFREKFSSGESYFLTVGAIHPRKNLQRVLTAFDQFKLSSDSSVKLVIVGRKAWKSGNLENTYQGMKHGKDVIFTGRLSDEELQQAYGAALALVYVPLLEGFGIPIVEAQQCDCPVITSNVTSMPEVGSGSVIQVDPFSEEQIKSALRLLSGNEIRRQQLILKGRTNVLRYSWEKSAQAMWDSMEKTLAQ
jgi:glycosyltransferase involved in cell wall biosynthesis